MKLLIGGDLAAARRRMRHAGIAGFVAAAISLSVAVMSYGAEDPEGRALLEGGGWAFAFVVVEAVLLAGLSWGVLKRGRAAGVALFGYFLASKSVAYALGWGNLTALPVMLLLGYLFFQGMRGACTYHHLTHPVYPAAGADAPST
ncbi:MAG TPA: hypothetical protein VI855_00830 [Dehalococcoidia bacterium]|nr:hypothetical protein [Dehalococcoidia bacterium]